MAITMEAWTFVPFNILTERKIPPWSFNTPSAGRHPRPSKSESWDETQT